jgi:hypothetical protein
VLRATARGPHVVRFFRPVGAGLLLNDYPAAGAVGSILFAALRLETVLFPRGFVAYGRKRLNDYSYQRVDPRGTDEQFIPLESDFSAKLLVRLIRIGC